MSQSFTLKVNGQTHTVSAEPNTPLLYILRNDLKLKGTRFGCGEGQCGACTVLIDGKAVQSCDTPLWSAPGHDITTIEGLGTAEAPGRLQQAFIDEQAVQCGYCINGIIMSVEALLIANPKPNDEQIIEALDRNLCRCGTHVRVLRAIKRVAGSAA
ncbi:MAG: (2Fe-2S)-binding protein [Proteobacteria bacterium]|nr:(2Fe-2S)-binding protein [Pseudomonadota bacterium]